MMKKALALLTALILLLVGAAPVASAQTEPSTSALDIVLVIDQSNSMHLNGTKAGADEEDYRIDAANIVTAMAGTDGSRVAVITFDNDATMRGSGWFDIKNLTARQGLMDNTSTWLSSGLHPGTDYGEALAQAFNLLQSRSDQERARNGGMIIVLTDGDNSFTGDANQPKPIYEWNEASGVFVDGERQRQSKDGADNMAYKVAEEAAERGYKIYTVGLGSNMGDARTILSNIATMTGGLYQPVSTGKELPDFFADLFAARVGSTRESARLKWDAATGTYSVNIPVLNGHIMEANLYLNTEYVRRDSLVLTNDRGEVYNLDDEAELQQLASQGIHVLKSKENIGRDNESNKFTLIKLVKPRVPGLWTLTFRPHNAKANGELATEDGAMYSLLFNYDIDLDFDTTYTDAQGNPTTNTTLKNNTLAFTSMFRDSEGSLVNEERLYWDMRDYDAVYRSAYGSDFDTECDWFHVQVHWQLGIREENGTWTEVQGARRGSFTPADTNGDGRDDAFTGTVDLSQVHTDSAGNNLLDTRKNYEIRVMASGAGLERTYFLPLDLTNRTPAGDAFNRTYNVDMPGNNPGDDAEACAISIDLPARDADGEKLFYDSLTPAGGTSDAFVLQLNGNNVSGGLVVENGEYRIPVEGVTAGRAYTEYVLTGHDAANEQPFTQTIKLTAVSGMISNEHTATLKVDYVSGSTFAADNAVEPTEALPLEVAKGSAITFALTPDQEADRAGDYTSIAFTYTDGVTSPRTGAVQGMQGTIADVGNREGSWTVTVDYIITSGGQGVTMQTKTFAFHVVNHDPTAAMDKWKDEILGETPKANADGSFDKVIAFDPVPVISLIDPASASIQDGQIVLQLSDLFADVDTNALGTGDKLTYTTATLKDGNGDLPRLFTCAIDQQAGTLTLGSFNDGYGFFALGAIGGGHETLTITAQDADGSQVQVVLQLQVVQLTSKWFTLMVIGAIVLAAAIITLMIIYQIQKPRYFRNAQMSVYEGPALQPSQVTEINRSKRTKVLRSVVDAECCVNAGIPVPRGSSILDLVVFKPGRGKYVLVRLKKPVFGATADLSGSLLNKKWKRWSKDMRLVLIGGENEYISIQLEDASEWSDSPEYSDDISGSMEGLDF